MITRSMLAACLSILREEKQVSAGEPGQEPKPRPSAPAHAPHPLPEIDLQAEWLPYDGATSRKERRAQARKKKRGRFS